MMDTAEVEASIEVGTEELLAVAKYVKKRMPDFPFRDLRHTVTVVGPGKVRAAWTAKTIDGHGHVAAVSGYLRDFAEGRKDGSVTVIPPTGI